MALSGSRHPPGSASLSSTNVIVFGLIIRIFIVFQAKCRTSSIYSENAEGLSLCFPPLLPVIDCFPLHTHSCSAIKLKAIILLLSSSSSSSRTPLDFTISNLIVLQYIDLPLSYLLVK